MRSLPAIDWNSLETGLLAQGPPTMRRLRCPAGFGASAIAEFLSYPFNVPVALQADP